MCTRKNQQRDFSFGKVVRHTFRVSIATPCVNIGPFVLISVVMFISNTNPVGVIDSACPEAHHPDPSVVRVSRCVQICLSA